MAAHQPPRLAHACRRSMPAKGRSAWAAALLVSVACAVLAFPAAGHGYRFGEPNATATGPEETIFDWSSMACHSQHVPDQPVRALRDASNRVQLILPHHESRRMVGSSLDTLANDCGVLMPSGHNPDPAAWDNLEWISSVYTTDGKKVHALVHDEYRGWDFAGMCTTQGTYDPGCWYNALTLATSTDGGNTYSHVAPPAHHVASSTYEYVPDASNAYGVFDPSNIVSWNGFYYALVNVRAHGAQAGGSCLMRTQDLDDPDSWRAWDGTAFNVRFIDPYVETDEAPEDHVCEPVAPLRIGGATQSLTWSSYFRRFLLVTHATGREASGVFTDGFWYSTSTDLINWTPKQLVMEAELPWTYECGDSDPVLYPSLIDPDSSSRNFETTDQDVYLYFTRFNYASCTQNENRDLIKIPIRLSNQVPGGPTAAFTATPDPTGRGLTVTFDASASTDADGSIVAYRWDLDGNGTLETDTGTSPIATRVYDTLGTVTVALRVVDDVGKFTDTTHKLKVENRLPVPSFTITPNPADTGQTVSFDGSASIDPDGSIVRYEWDLDGDGSFETDTGETPSASRAYVSAGTVTVRLRTTDNDGARSTADVTATIRNRAPTATFTATPNPSLIGQAVSFDGSGSSDPDGTISKYEWDLDGNGSFETNTGTTPITSKVFTAVDTVTVGLRVTDDGGATAQVSRVQEVKYGGKFNFQPSASVVPAGYTRDVGAAYSATAGYGWVRQDSLTGTRAPLNLTKNVVERNAHLDQRLDTLIFMQATAAGMTRTPGAWEVAVPNGTYAVTLSVGDPSATDSVHRINVENVNAIDNFRPTTTVRFASAMVIVTVNDGRLTIDARNGTNTKLNYVDIAGV